MLIDDKNKRAFVAFCSLQEVRALYEAIADDMLDVGITIPDSPLALMDDAYENVPEEALKKAAEACLGAHRLFSELAHRYSNHWLMQRLRSEKSADAECTLLDRGDMPTPEPTWIDMTSEDVAYIRKSAE